MNKLKKNEIRGESGKIYRDSMKFTEWTAQVLDKNKSETFGNFTQAALNVYGLDENDPRQYATASAIGSQNFRKLKDIASLTLQKKGVTFDFLMQVLLSKMGSSQSSNWWEIVMEMMGYRDRSTQVNVKQYNQNNYLAVKDEQLTEQFGKIGSEDLREEALAKILIEGDMGTEDE